MAAPASDLVTLAEVQEWLGDDGSNTDAPLLQRMISQVSRAVLNRTNRDALIPTRAVDYFDGTGSPRMLMRNFPVLDVYSVTVDGVSIPASSGRSNGYFFEPTDEMPPGKMQSLVLRGGTFSRGDMNVVIDYRYGYLARETHTLVGSALTFAAEAQYGRWASDAGVVYADTGAALVAVASSPTVGQYAVDAGQYTFAAADAGKSVTLAFGYIPADIARVCCEWVADRYRIKDRIGINSKSVGGQETVSFRNDSIPPFARDVLQNYMRVVPI